MRYAGFFSAGMEDLLQTGERERLKGFAENFLYAVERRSPTQRIHPRLVERPFAYLPEAAETKEDVGGKRVVIVTDTRDEGGNLARMITRLRESFSGETEVVDLDSVSIAGGCVGCVQCGYDNICAYHDGFMEFFSGTVQSADILILAGATRDRYLSARWKTFFDRSFFNNHVPSLGGKQVGFVISGPLAQLPNLRQILQAWTEIQQANLAGIVTDEPGESVEIDALLGNLASELVRLSRTGYVGTPTYLSVAAGKLFRDAVWGRLRRVFPADHRYYRRHGIYDFPQKNYGMRIMNGILYLFTRSRAMRMKTIRKLQELRMRQLRAIIGE
jgi:hypothetical protein